MLQPDTTILLIAHGSRLATANSDLDKLAEQLRSRFPNQVIETAYLELAEPTIPQGAEKCVLRGANRVLLMPYFLSAGTHVTNDLRRFQSEFATRWPSVRFDLCPPLGLHPLMLDIICERLTQAASSGSD